MSPPGEQGPSPLEWTVRPVEDRPLAGILALLVIVGLGVFVAIYAGDWIWGVLAAVLLFMTVSRFFLASRVQVSTEGILAEYPLITRQISWNQVVWIRHDQRSALVRTTRGRFRGRELTLLFGHHRDRAISLLQEWAPSGLLSDRTPEESVS